MLFRESISQLYFSYYSLSSGVNLLPIVRINLNKNVISLSGRPCLRSLFSEVAIRSMFMSQKVQTLMTPYLEFNRSQWAALRDSVPMTLTEGEIARLKGINEDLSLDEVAEIYLTLSR